MTAVSATQSLTPIPLDSEDLDELSADELTTLAPPPPEYFVPQIDLSLVHFYPELLETVPQEIAEQYQVLPVYLRKSTKKKNAPPGWLYIASADPQNQAALEDCALCCNLQVRLFLADAQELSEAIPIVYQGGQLARPTTITQALGAAKEPPTPPPPPVAPHNGVRPGPPESRAPSSSMPELPLVRPPGVHTAPASEHMQTSVSAPQAPEDLVVAVLGGDTELSNYSHEALVAVGGRVEVWGFSQTSCKDGGAPPTLLLVSEEIYLFDRRAFNLLALRLGAPLIVWSQEMDPADLQAITLAARRSRAQ